MVNTSTEDRLAATALTLAHDMRDNLTQAHRTVHHMPRLELEQLTCVLAAALPLDIPWPQLAWWRALPVTDKGTEGT